MIYLYDLPNGGVIATGDGGRKQIEEVIDRCIKEILTIPHNEPELQKESSSGRGIMWEIKNTANYTYTTLTKDKFEEILRDLTYGK